MSTSNPIEIGAANFRQMDEFPLKWRWTDSRWNLLPDEDLAAIHPLREAKAHDVFKRSLLFQNETGLLPERFDHIVRIDTAGNEKNIRGWLLARSKDVSQNVIVSWDRRLAIQTNWRVFCDYWDDFCYPASDDVTIWPKSEEWALVYGHHEELIFGARRQILTITDAD